MTTQQELEKQGQELMAMLSKHEFVKKYPIGVAGNLIINVMANCPTKDDAFKALEEFYKTVVQTFTLMIIQKERDEQKLAYKLYCERLDPDCKPMTIEAWIEQQEKTKKMLAEINQGDAN